MRAVVLGAAGFIGRKLVEKLSSRNIEVKAVDRVDSPFGPDAHYVKGDILDFEKINQVMASGDYVFHLAASPLPASLVDPRLNMTVNILGTLNVLEAARKNNVEEIVFTSASSVVGTVEYNPVDEKHPCVPKTPYAVAKKACEDYLRVYKDLFGTNYLVFRLFNVYGPGQLPAGGAIIPSIYERLRSGKHVDVFGDGKATRDYVYVDDVAELLCRAISSKVKNEILNLGTGRGTSILELVELASGILDVRPNITFKPARAGEIDNFVADVSKLTTVLGIRPMTDLEEGLKITFSWLSNVC
jgi:UDP-glucose 4-epimerase